MKRAFITMLLACVAVLTATSTWADRPENYERGPYPFGPFPMVNCNDVGMDYVIWAKGAWTDVGKMFFDKAGNPVKTVGKNTTIDGNIWIPDNPACQDPPFMDYDCWDWAAEIDPVPGTNVLTSEIDNGTFEHSQTVYRDWIWVDHDPDAPEGYWWPTWGQVSGLTMHIGVPGYGSIFVTAGHMTHRFDPATHDFEVISQTPNRTQPKAKDLYAMCAYIGNQ